MEELEFTHTPTSSSIKSEIDMSVPECHFQEAVQQSSKVCALTDF